MSVDRVNYLNIALMGLSLGAACLLPFEVFLFSYAVLGPLHYLTEISWLHDRAYFLSDRRWAGWLGLLTLCALATSGLFLPRAGPGSPQPEWATQVASWNSETIFAALLLAVIFSIARSEKARWTAVGGVAVLTLLVHLANEANRAALGSPLYVLPVTRYEILTVIFVPTLIHVFVFTAAFVLVGALKGRSVSGLLSLGVFFLCAVAAFFIPTGIPEISPEVRSAYQSSALSISVYLGRWLDAPLFTHPSAVFESPLGVAIARFIAWAYTYHYLNWFSKTSIIQWHVVPRARIAVVVLLWLASLAIYAWDYVLGLNVLLLMSLLHVYLEFPLNWQTFVEIGRALRPRAATDR